MSVENKLKSVEIPSSGLMSFSPKGNNHRKNQVTKKKITAWVKSSSIVMMFLLGMFSTSVMSAQTPCAGTVTETADGTPFVEGFTYEFITNVDGDVTINVELLDVQTGLVAFAQTYNQNLRCVLHYN